MKFYQRFLSLHSMINVHRMISNGIVEQYFLYTHYGAKVIIDFEIFFIDDDDVVFFRSILF